jgi:hypothetical protein
VNERDIAKGFSGLWTEFFPMLSPTFVIAFNEAFVRPILGRDGIVSAVKLTSPSHRPDVLAEFAFRFAAASYEAGVPVKVAARNEALMTAAFGAAVKRVRELRPNLSADEPFLDEGEQLEGVRLALVYDEFVELWPATEAVVFSPAVKGSGVLGQCLADLAIGKTLYEVKTVSRPFHSRDLRQLLIYFALQAVTGEKRWEYGGLLNPRMALFCTFSIDWLVMRLSGGRPPNLVFPDFLQALSRDSVLDRRF